MTSFARRRPVVWLAILLGFNLVLLSIQARNDQGQVLIRGWALTLVTPVVYALTGGAGFVSDSISTYFRLYSAESQNRVLRREITRLRLEAHRLRGLASLWQRSQNMSRLQQVYEFETVAARVIGRSAPFFQERILINAGTSDDVRPDSAVLHSMGVLGRVVSANLLSSEVEVITNSGAAVGGVVESSRLQGVVRGNGSELLVFDFVPNSEEVPPGSVILTSGWDRIYPPGMPVGTVVKSERGSVVYREILVRPFVDSSRVEEVFAVKRAADAARAEPASQTESEGQR